MPKEELAYITSCTVRKSNNVTPTIPSPLQPTQAAAFECSRMCVHRLVRFGAESKKGWTPFDVLK
jgi:hypothetical protein